MKILVVGPHPDDELLGCAGFLLRHKSEGATLGWLNVTVMDPAHGWSPEQIQARQKQVDQVREALAIRQEHFYAQTFPTMLLDTIPMGDLVGAFSDAVKDFEPKLVLIPHFGDIHSDHRVVFDAMLAATKWFRYPFVKQIMAYETISETDANPVEARAFHPNLFVNIAPYLDQKWQLLEIYASEMKPFPFPRSERAVKALAWYRGAQSGYEAAEAFQVLRQRID